MSEPRRRLFLAAAAEAASALARLLGCREPERALHCEVLDLDALNARLFPAKGASLSVFADLNGGVMGQSGLAFSREATAGLIESLLGHRPKAVLDAEGELPAAVRSALREVGNIGISAVAGVLGHCGGDAVVPSVPRLGTELTRALSIDGLSPDLGRLPAYLVDTELAEPDSTLPISIIWIPGE